MPNTTAILSILKTGRGMRSRHSALLTFETSGGGGEEYLRFVPAFFDMDFTVEIAAVKTKIAMFQSDYLKHVKAPSSRATETLLEQIRDLGEVLFHKLGCNKIFDELFRRKSITNLVIYTNDPAIPWQWTYDSESRLFACERFALGKLFMQDVNGDQLTSLQTFVNAEADDESALDLPGFLRAKSALILVGDWRENEGGRLKRATHEAASLLQTFRGRKFGNVTLVEGDDVKFLSSLRTMAQGLKIIHYAGHSSNRGLILGPKSIVSAESISSSSRRLTSNPVVFLNSCISGEIADIWKKSANLATAFLALGACGCVATSFPVSDPAAAKFSLSFYKEVLKSDNCASIGEIVRLVRMKQARDKSLKNDLTRLFFDYYGDPRGRLKASSLHRIRSAQTATYEGNKLYQNLKRRLRVDIEEESPPN